MGQQQTERTSFLKWSQDEWKRAVIAACVIGAAWGRFEYKSDHNNEKVIDMIEKHIIKDEADKEMIKFKQELMANDIAALKQKK